MHPPVPFQASPMGPYCGFCGPRPPMFTCSVCGTTQGLYMQGMAMPPAQGMGIAPLVAPVVQAPQGASPLQLQSELRSAAQDFRSGAARQLGEYAVDMVYAWVS